VSPRIAQVVLATAFVAGCRGQPSTRPPVRVVRDMFDQPRLAPQSSFTFYADGASMRGLPDGVVAQERKQQDEAFDQGTGPKGYIDRIPVPVDGTLLERGQERYDIFCAPCHDRTGSGQGTVTRRGFPASIDLASEHTRGLKDGEVFRIIGFGVRAMPGHRHQIPARDRWAIAAWVRVLEQSRHTPVADLGGDLPSTIAAEATAP